MSKPVNEWVQDAEKGTIMEELMSERPLFARLIEHSGESVGGQMRELGKVGELNTYSQPSRIPQQRQVEQELERE